MYGKPTITFGDRVGEALRQGGDG